MGPKETDRRVRKTKALLRQGLTALMREKAVKDITVTELARQADVNRGTFYFHYRDIYDMVEQLEAEMFEEFTAVLNAYDAATLRGGLRPILKDIFRFVDRNADMCASLFQGENTFFQRLKDLVYEKVAREWGQLYGFHETSNGDGCLFFLVAGTVGLVQAWVRSERRAPPEEMATLAERLILYGIDPLKRP